MCNVTSEAAGVGAGVLLRALEPLDGIAVMEMNRRTRRPTDLARGPARLTQAVAVDLGFDGVDLCADRTLWLGAELRPVGPIGTSVRIGITREVDRSLRFFERENPFVSGPKWLNI